MLFNSIHFVIFFPVVVAIYFILPYKFRTVYLLLASYYFYMCWQPIYVLVLIGLTLVDYAAGIRIARANSLKTRRMWLILSILSNIGMLFYFKYFNFAAGTIGSLFRYWHLSVSLPTYSVLLPLGISFHTFQSLGYIIDVYRGVSPPEMRLDVYALYVAYFPQLVAGPIERSTGLLKQLRNRIDFDYDRVTSGLRLMAWGFFKKLVIADHLAGIVNPVYLAPTTHSAFTLLKATYYFSFQIYCDFSGYSDIAIGAAWILGHSLMKNFDHPYEARSVVDFWRRWHISLSSWFRDYVYIPLGGNRTSPARWSLNIFIVFLLSGLWHGAQWTFVLWGILHGIYVLLSVGTRNVREHFNGWIGLNRSPRILEALRIAITFHLVTFAWILFRANSVHDACYIFKSLLLIPWHAWQHGLVFSSMTLPRFGWSHHDELAVVPVLLFMFAVSRIRRRISIPAYPLWMRWGLYVSTVLLILIVGQLSAYEFLYFQF